MVTVTNETELAKAKQDGEDMIEIVGELGDAVVKIKAKGSFAWAIAFAALGGAVALAMTGVGAPAAAVTAFAAVGTIGLSATTGAIALAVAAGGTAILTSLRDDYDIVEHNSKHVVLKRR